MTGSSARLSRPFRMAVDVRGRLLVVDDARDRGSVRLIDGNLTPPASFVRKSMKRFRLGLKDLGQEIERCVCVCVLVCVCVCVFV